MLFCLTHVVYIFHTLFCTNSYRLDTVNMTCAEHDAICNQNSCLNSLRVPNNLSHFNTQSQKQYNSNQTQPIFITQQKHIRIALLAVWCSLDRILIIHISWARSVWTRTLLCDYGKYMKLHFLFCKQVNIREYHVLFRTNKVRPFAQSDAVQYDIAHVFVVLNCPDACIQTLCMSQRRMH